MGWRWFLYNETLDLYYSTGSSCLDDVQDDIKYVLEHLGWTLDHELHYISDQYVQIDQTKVVG